MINPDVIAHLEKYFSLSQSHFASGDRSLAAFFAITTIEETAKVLILSTESIEKIERQELLWQSRNHRSKYLTALTNRN